MTLLLTSKAHLLLILKTCDKQRTSFVLNWTAGADVSVTFKHASLFISSKDCFFRACGWSSVTLFCLLQLCYCSGVLFEGHLVLPRQTLEAEATSQLASQCLKCFGLVQILSASSACRVNVGPICGHIIKNMLHYNTIGHSYIPRKL